MCVKLRRRVGAILSMYPRHTSHLSSANRAEISAVCAVKMASPPHIIYQSAHIQLDINRHTLRGTTTFWALYDENEEIPRQLHLNCRQCKVENVAINNIECSFMHSDGLKNLSVGESDESGPSFNGEELDLSFRAALELSKVGELRIEIPSGIRPSVLPTPKLPRRAPKEIVSRFEKLDRLQHEIQNGDRGAHVLVVTMNYFISDPLDCWGGWSFGYFEKSKSESSNPLFSSPVVSHAVTRHGSCISLCDVDGIRTWLPCVDDPGRQSIFDISITVPTYCKSGSTQAQGSTNTSIDLSSMKYRVACSGILVTATPVAPGMGLITACKDECTTFRYITPHRIPACSIGVFIGTVKDTFVVPLYQAQGHIWVASNSIIGGGDNISDSGMDSGISSLSKGKGKISKSHSSGTGEARASQGANLAATIKHTFLGFDAAVRHVHKSISRRFQYGRCTIICVPDLECDFLSYDGLFCVSSKWLHGDNCIYMETPCHINLLHAYLYTWLKSSILIDSFNSEFLIHGAVGFMLNEYIEFLFGAEEARYRFYKQLQNVICYEKTSNSFSLSCPFPEDYQRCGEVFSQYLQNKSVVLFHIISHRLGGNVDVVLKAIRNIVKTKEIIKHASGQSSSMAPPSLAPPTPSGGGHSSIGSGHVTPMLSPVPGTPSMASPMWQGSGNTSVVREDPHYKDMNMSFSSVMSSGRKRSDSIASVGSDHGDISSSWKIDPSELKASTLTGGSVGAAPGSSPGDVGKALSSPDDHVVDFTLPLPPPVLVRQTSSTSSVGAIRPPASLEELLWGADLEGGNTSNRSFLADIRDMSGGAGADLNDMFLDQWVHAPGCMFLRAGVHVDTKNKKVDIALHQARQYCVCYNRSHLWFVAW